MQKVLHLIALSLFIWGISLIWPEISELLTPKVAEALVVGLVVATAAYFLGRQFRTQPRPAMQPSSPIHAQRTHPAIPVIYPFSRTPRPTHPIPALITPDLHTRFTRPMPVVVPQAQHSRITRPMPIALTR